MIQSGDSDAGQRSFVQANCCQSTPSILANCNNAKLLKFFVENGSSVLIIQPKKAILQAIEHDLAHHPRADFELRDCVLGGGQSKVVWYEYNDSRFDGLAPPEAFLSRYPNLTLAAKHARPTHSLDELVIPWIKGAEGVPRRNINLILGLSGLEDGFHLSDDILTSGIDQVFLCQALGDQKSDLHHERLWELKQQLEEILKQNFFSCTEVDDYGISLWRRDWYRRMNHLEEAKNAEIHSIHFNLDTVSQQLHQLVQSSGELEAERDQLTAKRDQLTAQRDQLTAERDQLTAQRDQLTAERDQLKAQHDQLCCQRDQLTAQRDQLTAERDQLKAQHGQLCGQRDQLTAQRDHLTMERDQLTAQRDQFAEERGQAISQRDQANEERDGLRAHRDELAEERDQAILERDQANEERDGLRAHRDQLAEERDQLADARNAVSLELENISRERAALNGRLEDLVSQHNLLKVKVESSEAHFAHLKDLFVQINLAKETRLTAAQAKHV